MGEFIEPPTKAEILSQAVDRLRRIDAGENPRKVHDMVSEGATRFTLKEVERSYLMDCKAVAEAYLYEHDQTPLTEEILAANGFVQTLVMMDSGNFTHHCGFGINLRRSCQNFALCSRSFEYIGPISTIGELRRILSVFWSDVGEIKIPNKEESTNA